MLYNAPCHLGQELRAFPRLHTPAPSSLLRPTRFGLHAALRRDGISTPNLALLGRRLTRLIRSVQLRSRPSTPDRRDVRNESFGQGELGSRVDTRRESRTGGKYGSDGSLRCKSRIGGGNRTRLSWNRGLGRLFSFPLV